MKQMILATWMGVFLAVASGCSENLFKSTATINLSITHDHSASEIEAMIPVEKKKLEVIADRVTSGTDHRAEIVPYRATSLISIRVYSVDSERAATLANTIAQAYLDGVTPPLVAHIVEQAVPAGERSK
jgi:hypothetical protein